MKPIIFLFFSILSFAISAQTITINQTYTSSTSITPFTGINSLSSLTVSGSATLLQDTGIVRIILMDKNLNEYLLFEGHIFSMTGSSMSFTTYSDETKYLTNIIPSSIHIIAKNATVTINSLQYSSTASPYSATQIQTLAATVYKTNIDSRIATMNLRLKSLGYNWTVCAKPSSYSSFALKRNMVGFGSDDYNNYSLEHYCSGPIAFPLSKSLPSDNVLKSASSPTSFNWQTRHGAMNPASPYYNPTSGCKGWINQKRYQWDENPKPYCGTCVLFASVAMV